MQQNLPVFNYINKIAKHNDWNSILNRFLGKCITSYVSNLTPFWLKFDSDLVQIWLRLRHIWLTFDLNLTALGFAKFDLDLP